MNFTRNAKSFRICFVINHILSQWRFYIIIIITIFQRKRDVRSKNTNPARISKYVARREMFVSLNFINYLNITYIHVYVGICRYMYTLVYYIKVCYKYGWMVFIFNPKDLYGILPRESRCPICLYTFFTASNNWCADEFSYLRYFSLGKSTAPSFALYTFTHLLVSKWFKHGFSFFAILKPNCEF